MAQLVARGIRVPEVDGSSPSGPTMLKQVVTLVIICGLLMAWARYGNIAASAPLEPVRVSKSSNQEELVTIKIADKVFAAELARTPVEQAHGLSDRNLLPPNKGMLFIFDGSESQSFWMKDMRFDLDIIWIANDKVIGIERHASKPLPNTEDKDLKIYNSGQPVNYVLEVPAGAGDSLNVGNGVTISFNQGS